MTKRRSTAERRCKDEISEARSLLNSRQCALTVYGPKRLRGEPVWEVGGHTKIEMGLDAIFTLQMNWQFLEMENDDQASLVMSSLALEFEGSSFLPYDKRACLVRYDCDFRKDGRQVHLNVWQPALEDKVHWPVTGLLGLTALRWDTTQVIEFFLSDILKGDLKRGGWT